MALVMRTDLFLALRTHLVLALRLYLMALVMRTDLVLALRTHLVLALILYLGLVLRTHLVIVLRTHLVLVLRLNLVPLFKLNPGLVLWQVHPRVSAEYSMNPALWPRQMNPASWPSQMNPRPVYWKTINSRLLGPRRTKKVAQHVACIYCFYRTTKPKLLVLHCKRIHNKLVQVLKKNDLKLPPKNLEKKVD
uniref:Uncharacterized protein n=2 Tax=Cacopsylla melanoneura TaxID=428564 RepID=A0A8D8M8W8_9HEMI